MRAVAYIDEAGEKGLNRNLTPERDAGVGLISAVVFPGDHLVAMREAYREGFNRFCAAAPAGATHHFTDAFKSGAETWAVVADHVRNEFVDIIRAQPPPIVYDARRLALQRAAHDRRETLKSDAKAARQNTTVRISEHPSNDRVDFQLIEGLVLKLDAFATNFSLERIDLWFDQIDDPIAEHYGEVIARLRTLSANERRVKGWDLDAKAPVEGSIAMAVDAPFELDVTRIGEVKVVGKSDPLVLVADMIANSLHRHLTAHPTDAALNAPSSIEGWMLASRVYGVRERAVEDLI